MNDVGREQIQQALALIEQAKGLLEVVLAQEREDFDNMPEDLRNDETGQRAEDTIDALERAATCCDGTVSAVCSEVFGPAKGTIQTLPLLDFELMTKTFCMESAVEMITVVRVPATFCSRHHYEKLALSISPDPQDEPQFAVVVDGDTV